MTQVILVTGGQGQIGQELARHAWPYGVDLLLPTRAVLDLADRESIERYVGRTSLSGIINCAAYTAVDDAEDEADLAYAVNARGVGWLARAARIADIPLVHVSTDYVFGTSSTGNARRESDPARPSGVYGASKLAGEIAAMAACDRLAVVRTAWVVSPFRSNFVKAMLRLAADRDQIDVVADQRGCPTGASDIATALATIVLRMISGPAPTGIYHFVNAGEGSWADLAEAVMDEAVRNELPHARINRIGTTAFRARVERPRDSRLDIGKIARDYDIVPRDWKAMVASTVAELAVQVKARKSK